MTKIKNLTDRQIQEQINALEEANRNTLRLSMGRGYGWCVDAMEKRRKKILWLEAILFARKMEKTKPTPKKQGLTRTWNSKTKQWNYKYTKRTKKTKKKQPDIKLSQHDKLLLAGKYKIRDKPKTVRNFGNVVTGGLKKTNKTTKAKAKRKKRRKVKSKAQQRTLFEGVIR